VTPHVQGLGSSGRKGDKNFLGPENSPEERKEAPETGNMLYSTQRKRTTDLQKTLNKTMKEALKSSPGSKRGQARRNYSPRRRASVNPIEKASAANRLKETSEFCVREERCPILGIRLR